MNTVNAKIIRIEETSSTNEYLRNYKPQAGEEMTVVTADYQTADNDHDGVARAIMAALA